MAGSEGRVLLDEELEGELESTADLLFFRIGASVSLKPSECRYDLKDPPKRPLAVSERFGLLFVGHSEGFFVTKTRDAIKLAKETKEIDEMNKKEKVAEGGRKCPTVQGASISDVRIGKVSILALSVDSLALAATVDGEIHLFSVPSLVKKSQNSPVSCSPGNDGSIKDLLWCKKREKCFIVLLTSGSLFSGNMNGNLKKVEENVDAVDWSIQGNLLAVAKNNMLRILSEKFEAQVVMDFMFESKLADSGHQLKVDSIKWATCRSIIVGCTQQDEDGLESDYLVQVITSGEGGFQASSKPVIVSFMELFSGIDDQVSGGGPHLFAKYLECWRVAVLANRRNMDSNIVLLELHGDDENKKPVALELEEEKYTPRIELQENGDENFILGLDVDKISLYEKLTLVKEGRDMELTPCCILVCLTMEGKIVLFHVARSSDPPTPLPVSSEVDISDIQEENSSVVLSTLSEPPVVAPNLKNDKQKSSMVEVKQDKQLSTALELKKVNESLAFSNVVAATNAQVIVTSPIEMPTNQVPGTPFVGLPSAQPSVSAQELGTVLPGKPGFFPSYGNFVRPSAPAFHMGVLGSNVTAWSPPQSSIGGASSIKQVSVMQVQFPGSQSLGRSDAVGTETFPSVTKDDPAQAKLSGVPRPSLSEDYQLPRAPQALSSSLEISKHLYNVNDMVKELDKLLVAINQEGGFADNCTLYLKNSVLALEKGLESISEKYWTCKGAIAELVAKVQHLQHKMVQVSAREGYMEGVVKQASNSRYWDIWSRQKLGPEFELKQQKILKLNQDLRNQLIQLERHFNALELKRFGDSSGTSKGRRSMNTSESSRRIQTVHRLYNTVVSQLSAAEHLSECLTEQMTMLKIVSPSVKQQSIARDLLESIGVTCPSDSFESPDVKGTARSSISTTKHPMSISFNTFKEPVKKDKSNILKCLEPETVRRRRDSLDRSLACFEPQKMTVKRMMQQEYSRISAGYFSRETGETFSDEALKDAGMHEKARENSTPPSLQPSIYKCQPEIVQSSRGSQQDYLKLSSGAQAGSISKQMEEYPQSTQSALEFRKWRAPDTKVLQTTNTIPSPPASVSSTLFSGIHVKADVSSSMVNLSSKPGTTGPLKSSLFGASPVLRPSSDADNKALTNETTQKLWNSVSPANLQSSETGGRLQEGMLGNISERTGVSSSSTVTVKSNQDAAAMIQRPGSFSSLPAGDKGNALKVDAVTSKSVTPSISISSQTPVPSALSSASSATTPLSSSSALPIQKPAITMVSEGISHVSKEPSTVALPSSTLIASSPIPFPSSHVPSLSSTSSVMQQNSVSHPAIISTLASTTLSVPLFSGAQLGSAGSTTQVSIASSSPTLAFTSLSTITSSTVSSGSSAASLVSSSMLKEKEDNLNLDDIQEDEMEEEAPDASSSLDLGSLGGLGLFSTPTTSSPKTNPFGGSLGSSASPISFPLSSSTPPGQLFRPASLTVPSIQLVQSSQLATSTGVSGAFSGFGQPAQVGAGQQAQGSVLGAFGQSRQVGSGQGFGFGSVGFGGASVAASAGSSFSPTSGFAGAATGGFAAVKSTGGFAGAASGGFAVVASSGIGFAGAGSGGGFGTLGSAGGGFAGAATGGGFASLGSGAGSFAGVSSGGGFGAVASGGGGFGGANSGGFGSASGAGKPPAELLMKMRK